MLHLGVVEVCLNFRSETALRAEINQMTNFVSKRDAETTFVEETRGVRIVATLVEVNDRDN